MRRWVYFIRPEDGEGPVKIGCSQHPEGRVLDLMTWSPYPLVIAARIEGGFDLERQFHALFWGDHSHREWFRPSARLAEVIEQVQAGTFDVSGLPSADKLPARNGRTWNDEERQHASLKHLLRLRYGYGFQGAPPEWLEALKGFAQLPERARRDLLRIVKSHRPQESAA